MEYTKGIVKDKYHQQLIDSHDYEQASNSYLMAIVAVIVGMPLPIINLIAAAGYYLAHRKSSYFVRWHCIQSAVGQAMLIPFNSIAVAWTLGLLLRDATITVSGVENGSLIPVVLQNMLDATSYYWMYISFILLLNVSEFFVVINTASRVRKGENVRWWLIAAITDRVCSKEDRNPYKI